MCKTYFYNEDCFATMKRMQSKDYKVDVILTSPPYNTARTGKNQRAFDNYENRYDIHLDNKTDDEYAEWTANLFNEFDKILKPNGTVIYNISYGTECPNSMWKALMNVLNDTDFMIGEVLSWHKKSALPNNVSSTALTRICEFVFVFCRKSEYKTYNTNKKVKSVSRTGQKYYENMYNYIEAPNNDGANKLNKATYSSELCEKLLNIYGKPNSTVYDPFMGTGTTAIACYKMEDMNYTAIGSELSEAQVEYSKQRLNDLKERQDGKKQEEISK